MSDKEKTKEYHNGDLTVVWKPSICIHSGICVQMLPDVYDPKGKPWIQPENASIDELKNQIKQCPSGALSFYMKSEQDEPTQEEDFVKIHARANGSLLIEGMLEVTKPDGTVEIRKGRATFCRCGASQNMPFCDGSHKKTGFTG